MTTLTHLAQLIIALGIVNVWIVRYRHSTPFRPAGAENMEDEFRRYGFPDWVRSATGATKLTLAALLVVGIWVPSLAVFSGAAMAALMAVAVFAHFRVSDPVRKAVPALSMLLLSAFVVIANGGV